MDDSLSFDVYVVITDPPWQVEHEASESRVSVQIGEPPNELQVWFKDPDTVTALGRELATAGMRLAAQLRTPLPDSDSGQHDSSKEYPMPGREPRVVESGDER
jgi:hypothetical protein